MSQTSAVMSPDSAMILATERRLWRCSRETTARLMRHSLQASKPGWDIRLERNEWMDGVKLTGTDDIVYEDCMGYYWSSGGD